MVKNRGVPLFLFGITGKQITFDLFVRLMQAPLLSLYLCVQKETSEPKRRRVICLF